jgi:hypothetical protein
MQSGPLPWGVKTGCSVGTTMRLKMQPLFILCWAAARQVGLTSANGWSYFLENVHHYDNNYSKDLAELLPHNFKLQNQNCIAASPKPLKFSEHFRETLTGLPNAYEKRIRLVALNGASNVLGTFNNLPEIGRISHNYGAQLLVDAAQLVAHCRVNMAECGIDYLAFSGHKVYAPFGSGALVARKGLLKYDIG